MELCDEVFTKNTDGIKLDVDNLNVTCITSKNSKFNIDSDGNITAKSITLENNTFNNNDNIIDIVYPVGSIYLTVSNINPSTIFGGEWESFASGKTLVGFDINDDDFNIIEKVGGSKYLQSHSHTLRGNTEVVSSKGNGYWNLPSVFEAYNAGNGKDIYKYNVYTANTGEGNSGNLQPYITCYIWKRIL